MPAALAELLMTAGITFPAPGCPKTHWPSHASLLQQGHLPHSTHGWMRAMALHAQKGFCDPLQATSHRERGRIAQVEPGEAWAGPSLSFHLQFGVAAAARAGQHKLAAPGGNSPPCFHQ